MRPAEKIDSVLRHAVHSASGRAYHREVYPKEIIDLVIFHKLHLTMNAENAMRSYHELRSQFVDWNEVRVSSLREIQEQLGDSSSSLELAIFIKDFLEFVHREHHSLSLEFLAEQNLGEIRRYLKQIRGVDGSTVDLILHLRKEHPVFPLNQSMEAVLRRLGFGRNGETRDRKQRQLHGFISPERTLSLHHYLLNHSREFCPIDDTNLDCPHCSLRKICSYYARMNVKRSKSIPRRSRSRVMRKSLSAKRVRSSTSQH